MSGEGWVAATTPANARALSLRKVQSNVGGRRALGKAADGNIGNPSFRLGADSLQGDTARGLGWHAASNEGNSLAQRTGIHIVQQQMACPCSKARLDLGDIINL